MAVSFATKRLLLFGGGKPPAATKDFLTTQSGQILTTQSGVALEAKPNG